MAKRPEIKPEQAAGLFQKTEPEQAQLEPAADPVKAIGIGLKTSEWDRIDQIAREVGMKRGGLAAYALRDFIRRYTAGEIPTKTETKKTLPGV